jgi:putative FmdB family regulatory protein
MPTYEYECEKCGHRFDVFQSMNDEPTKRCPKCKGKVRRLIGTGAGMIFKGSGFYATDYRSESYKSQKSSESSESPAAPPKPDAPKPKPEGKPEHGRARKKKSDSA